MTAPGESHEVDARPSDALNLALRVGAPVFLAGELIDQTGVAASRISEAKAGARGGGAGARRAAAHRQLGRGVHLLLGFVGANEEVLLDFGVEAHRVREEMHRPLGALPPGES